MMHGPEKSDPGIVAMKPANEAGRPGEERRAGTKGNADQRTTRRTQGRERVHEALARVREAAKLRKRERFTALFHHISIEALEAAFFALKRDAAPGADRLVWKDYGAHLERRLEDLHDRVQRGAYRALPSRRVYIPKPDGRKRPLAVAALEDKIVQRAVAALLNAIYEEDFLGFSYGFRPGRREATGDMIIVRYADDFIVGLQHESDARRFLDAMRERLREFALSLHPEKTRLIEFGRFAAERRKRRGLGKPETFSFLGFTFISGKTQSGKFQIKRKSRADRMRAKLKEIKEQLKRRMHQPIPDQGRWLRSVVDGYFAYHAVPTNARSLDAFRHHVLDLWRRMLRRRSQKAGITWDKMAKLADAWLPKPVIRHPWPSDRFAATHPRWEPYAGKPHVRFCAGGRRMKPVSLPLPGLHPTQPNFSVQFGMTAPGARLCKARI